MKLKCLLSVLAGTVVLPSSSVAYQWKEFNGKFYAATQVVGTWSDAQAEAVAIGVNLVAINDAAEEAWLCDNFKGISNTNDHTPVLAWIGLLRDSTMAAEPWYWVNGDPDTYSNICGRCPRPQGEGLHMYLHTNNHASAPCKWNYHVFHDNTPTGYVHGIMEADAIPPVTFDWATVANPENPADPFNEGSIPGIGSVANDYRIAKHEVTNDQYAEFLNAMAGTDTNALYSASMGSDPVGGITRSGTAPNLSYAVKANMGNKPVNYVSFFDAMRFVNWLHNGQPTGAQDASTTEEGVYTISNGVSETRACDARFFIPTENEWYKAAYHQPAADGGGVDDYWLYPAATNSVPTPATAIDTVGPTRGDISNPGPNVANYASGAVWNGIIGNVTTVGSAGAGSQSFYGTSDQGGNVWEWNEAVVFGSLRVIRGGAWKGSEGFLRSSFQPAGSPPGEDNDIGFRVASPFRSADLDGDGHVDLIDFGLFQEQFTGPQ